MSTKRFRTIDEKRKCISDVHNVIVNRATEKALTNKKFAVLRFMVDGEQSLYFGTTYGGHGRAYLNFEGGFAYDATVKRMVKNELITINRELHHTSRFDGYPSVNVTVATITDKGRKLYEKHKKKINKRFGYNGN